MRVRAAAGACLRGGARVVAFDQWDQSPSAPNQPQLGMHVLEEMARAAMRARRAHDALSANSERGADVAWRWRLWWLAYIGAPFEVLSRAAISGGGDRGRARDCGGESGPLELC